MVSTAFLAIVAMAVSECSQIVGVLLVFTLMVGPPAAAQQLSLRLWTGVGLSAALALADAWLGIALAFYSDWPVSFCISMLSALTYFLALARPKEIRRLRQDPGRVLVARSRDLARSFDPAPSVNREPQRLVSRPE
jgi:zinc/manganese transport system permease protein